MRLFDLEVGADGRNRMMLSPFRARTGRNQPSNSKFIFGPSTWLRGLIQPPPGRALAYVDWSSQEVAIVAALSGDEKMIAAVESGDVYLASPRAPAWPGGRHEGDARRRRGLCKVVVLAMNYGMAPDARRRLGIGRRGALLHGCSSDLPAASLLEPGRRARPLLGYVETVFGWPVHGCSGPVHGAAQLPGASQRRRDAPLGVLLATRRGSLSGAGP